MKEKEYIKKYIDEAEKELRELFTDLIYDHNDSDGQYELQNLTSGFNTLLEYARKWQESQETGLTAAEAVDALLAGKKIRRKIWEKGQYACLNSKGDVINQNGDYYYLPLIQCENTAGAISADQAGALRSELCLKLWEEVK